MKDAITVETRVQAPIETVWRNFTDPEAIKVWNAASGDWHTPHAENEVKAGGTFSYRMEARDGSAGFDLVGIYDAVTVNERLAYTMGDGRKVEVTFTPDGDGVRVTETFEPETENPHELQRAGWQAILNNFKKYSEGSR